MHQPQDASVMQARQFVYTEQSELAKGCRNCAVKGYKTKEGRNKIFVSFQPSALLTPQQLHACIMVGN